MKTLKAIFLSALSVLSLGTIYAQDSESPFSVGADVVSNYVWRGTKVAGPSIQPGISFSSGGFEIGAWGSWTLGGKTNEADLFAAYSFDFGLSLGVTDYYYQGEPYFAYKEGESHAFEGNVAYGIGDFSIAANYIFNEGAGAAGGDTYLEASYAFKYFEAFIGMGDGWHTGDGDFEVCNIGIGTSREIKITDGFSLPIFGQVIVNPNQEQFNLVVGLSF